MTSCNRCQDRPNERMGFERLPLAATLVNLGMFPTIMFEHILSILSILSVFFSDVGPGSMSTNPRAR